MSIAERMRADGINEELIRKYLGFSATIHFCTTPHLYEPEIQQKFLNAFSRYFGQKDVVIKNCLFVLHQLKLQDEHNIQLQAEFDKINEQLKGYIESGGTDSNYSELNARYEEIAAKIDSEE